MYTAAKNKKARKGASRAHPADPPEQTGTKGLWFAPSATTRSCFLGADLCLLMALLEETTV
jgi:hypothetical protein